jgi:hypothetical protein
LVELIEVLPNSGLKDMLIPILEESSWKTYYEVGQRFFNIHGHSELFFDTPHSWYTIIILLWHGKHFKKLPNKPAIQKAVFSLRESPIPQIAYPAQHFETYCNGGTMESEALTIVERVLFFKKCDLFSNVLSKDLVHIAEKAKLLTYAPGQLVSRQGDKAIHIFLIEEGSVDIIQNHGKPHEELIETLHPFQTYGEAGALSRGIRVKSAVARKKSRIYVIEYSEIRKTIATTPSLSDSIIRYMGRKILTREKAARVLKED